MDFFSPESVVTDRKRLLSDTEPLMGYFPLRCIIHIISMKVSVTQWSSRAEPDMIDGVITSTRTSIRSFPAVHQPMTRRQYGIHSITNWLQCCWLESWVKRTTLCIDCIKRQTALRVTKRATHKQNCILQFVQKGPPKLVAKRLRITQDSRDKAAQVQIDDIFSADLNQQWRKLVTRLYCLFCVIWFNFWAKRP